MPWWRPRGLSVLWNAMKSHGTSLVP
jgi:hypothetical protein